MIDLPTNKSRPESNQVVTEIASSVLFDYEYYASKFADGTFANRLDAIEHYVRFGEAAGYKPNILFDPAYYRETDDGISEFGNLLHDYIMVSWRQGRRPHPLFDGSYYAENNPDIVAAGVNYLHHFIASGGQEGRRPHPLFHSWNYMHHGPGRSEPGTNPLIHYLRTGLETSYSPHDAFNAAFYLSRYPDVRAAGSNPLLHFVTIGAAERRLPNESFSWDSYMLGGGDPGRIRDIELFWKACDAPESGCDDLTSMRNAIRLRTGLSNDGLVGVRKAVDSLKVIAFYLPQFHPIPANDANWGAGFTEWVNVRHAVPNFPGHYQPRVPAELGYYDLREPEVMQHQSELAKQYGIHGFCYYWYWFNGQKPLELPLAVMLESGSPDMPFCLCWANEGWTRKWAGGEQVIYGHEYSDQDDERHVAELIRYMRDPRYIRVDGAPLLLIYRAGALPDASRYTQSLRKVFEAAGEPVIHLAMVESAEFAWAGQDPRLLGFDCAVEFPPHGGSDPLPSPSDMTNPDFDGSIFDYRRTVMRYSTAAVPDYPRYRTTMCGWDNTARYQDSPAIFVNATPGLYQAWLEAVALQEPIGLSSRDRIVFVNAWNEWGEGTYLEPDARWGRGYLEATKAVVDDYPLQNGVLWKSPASDE